MGRWLSNSPTLAGGLTWDSLQTYTGAVISNQSNWRYYFLTANIAMTSAGKMCVRITCNFKLGDYRSGTETESYNFSVNGDVTSYPCTATKLEYVAHHHWYELDDNEQTVDCRVYYTDARISSATITVPQVASSGSFLTDAVTFNNGNMAIQFSWSKGTPDATNNTTPITWSIKGYGTYTGYVNTGPIRVYINGSLVYEAYTGSSRLQMRNGMVITNGSFNAVHDSNGQCGAFSAYINAAIYDLASNKKGYGYWMLDNIARKSTITASGGTLGTSQSMTINKTSPNFTHSISYTCGSDVGNIAWMTSDSVVNWTPPYSLASQQTGSTTLPITLNLTTYSGNTAIGINSYNYNYTIPDDANTKPTATISCSASHSLSSTFDGLYIQGKSKVGVSFSDATGQYGASISSYGATVEGRDYTGSSPVSDFLSQSGSQNIYGYVTDSRGISSLPITSSITVIPYSRPSVIPYTGLSSVVCIRTDQYGDPSSIGTYLRIRAGRSYSTVTSNGTQNNFCILRYRYKTSDSDSYSGWTTLIEKNSTASDVIDTTISGIVTSATTSYDIQIGVEDDIGESNILTIKVPSQEIALHLGRGGMSVGIGRAANYTSNHRVDVGWDTYFEEGVYIQGEELADFIVEQGTSGIWTYRKWNSGISECWGICTETLTHYNTINNWYCYYTEVSFVSGLFKADSIPTVMYSGGAGNVFSTSCMVNVLDNASMYCYALASSGGSQEIRFHIHAKGLWK